MTVHVTVAHLSRLASPSPTPHSRPRPGPHQVPASLTFFYAVVGFNEASMDDLKTRGWLFPPHDGLPIHALWTTRDYSALTLTLTLTLSP